MNLDLCHVNSRWSRDPIFDMDLEERLDFDLLSKCDPFFYQVENGGINRQWLRNNLSYIPLKFVKDWPTPPLFALCVSGPFCPNPKVVDELHLRPESRMLYSLWMGPHHSVGVDPDWNILVDAYNELKNFTFGLPDFDVTLDWTNYSSDGGHGFVSKTYLDGSVAFLVHYKGKYVMTIGFTFSGDRKLILKQIQPVNEKGNRWLFKIPGGRLNYVVERMVKCFSSFTVCLPNADDQFAKIIQCYPDSRERTQSKEKNEKRYTRFYSQPLKRFVRRKWTKYLKVRYYCLVPRNDGHASMGTLR